MSSQTISDFRRRRKINLIKVCGDQCNICGYNKTVSALEFHHIIPQNKKYGVSSGTCHQLEDDLIEIQKCILVCANCHREIHEGLYSEDFLLEKKIFKKEIAEQLIKERDDLKKVTHYYCKTCGKEITRGANYCSNCVKETQRIVKNRPSRDELKHLIRTIPFTKIGEMYNVTDNAIRKWCKSCNLPSKSSEIKKYTDEDWANI